MRQEAGIPETPLNDFREYWYRITQIGSAEQFILLEEALQSEDPKSLGGPIFLEFLSLYLELRKLDLNPHRTFSSETLAVFIGRTQSVMLEVGKAFNQTPEPTMSKAEETSLQVVIDADELDFFSLQLHLLILRFQAHYLRYNNTPPPTRENLGLLIPPLSIHDVLEGAFLLQEELGKSSRQLSHESTRELLKNSQHLATHNSKTDLAYFKQFSGTISNLWKWQFYQFDREFSEVLEWAYQRSSEEKFLELQELFLSLLLLRRYPYSTPEKIQVFKQYKFSYAILNRTPKNLDRFKLFCEDFEKLKIKLSCYAIHYTIDHTGKSYDPEYLSLIREFFRFHFQFQMWRQLHSNEQKPDFSPENEMRILIMWHSTEAMLGVYLWHSKLELTNLFRPIVYFDHAFEKILATLERDEGFRLSGPGVLDLLLGTVLHKMFSQYRSVLVIRQFGYSAINSAYNPFAEGYVLPKNTQVEETFLGFIHRIKGRFQAEKDGQFFSDVANIFCRFFAFKLGDKKYSLKELQDFHASKIGLPIENQTERSLILESFCRIFDFQLMENPRLQNSNELLCSYVKLWKFLEGKTPSLLMTLGVLEDHLNSFLEINRKHMEGGIAKNFLKNVDDSRKILLQRCKAGFLSRESTANQKTEKPKKPRPPEASKKKPVVTQAPLKSTAPAVAKISPQEKYLSEYQNAGTLVEKASALVRLAKVSEVLAGTQKWVEEFFRIVFVENLGNEALGPQIEEMMTFLESQKWIPINRKSPFPKSVSDLLGAFFQRNRLEDLKNEAERVDLILSLIGRLQIMVEMKEWFERLLESVARAPGLNLNNQIESILEKLKLFQIVPFSRKMTISRSFFRGEKNSSTVLDFFADKQIPVYIFGGAVRDFMLEQNRSKKARANKIISADLDIFVDLGKQELLTCLVGRFGEIACKVIGGDKSYYIKISFAEGPGVDVISLREEASEPLMLTLLRKTDAFNFNINCGIYSIQDDILYSFRNAFENIANLQFHFADPINKQCDQPEHIFRAMDLLAKYQSKSLQFSLRDEEVYYQKLAHLNSRWAEKGPKHADLSERERKLVNNTVLKLFCSGNALFSLAACAKYRSFPVLFPSLKNFAETEAGHAYLRKSCELADIVFTQDERKLKNAHYSFKIGYLLSLFFCQPIMEQNAHSNLLEAVTHHVQSCLFWTQTDTAIFVESNIQAVKRNQLSIFFVAESWLKNKHKERVQKMEASEGLAM